MNYLGDSQTNYIVVSSHGTTGKIVIPTTVDGSVKDQVISAESVRTFLSVSEEFYIKNSKTGNYNTFKALKSIASYVKNGENSGLIFYACHAGNDEGGLGKQLAVLFGKRINVYLNTNFSQSARWYFDKAGNAHYYILDGPISHNGEPGNFILINPNGKVIPLNGTLQLNSTGNPISVVPLNDPDPKTTN